MCSVLVTRQTKGVGTKRPSDQRGRERANVTWRLDQEHLCMRRKKHLACSAILFLSVMAFSGASVLAQQNVGFVLAMQGKWADGDGRGFLKLGQMLPAEAVLTNAAPVDGDHVVVANLHGEIVKTIRCKEGVCRECTESGACYDPIHPLPKTTDSRGSVVTMLNAVLDLFAEKPERYSVHRVRGEEPEVIRSEVLRLERNTMELSSLLEGKEKGRYAVQFVPISEKTNRGEKLQPPEGAINWNPGEKAAFTLNGIAPGLYEILLYHGSSTTTAWILLSTGADYERLADSFKQFVRETESWGNNVSPVTKQAYQRAFLECLDLHGTGSNR